MSASGVVLVLTHITAIGAAAGLLYLTSAVGVAALQLCKCKVDPVEGVVLGTTVGITIAASLMLAACALVGVNVAGIAGPLVTMLVFARKQLLPTGRMMATAARQLAGWNESAGNRGLAAASLAGGVALLILLSLPPVLDWDSLVYHLEVPSRWLQAGRLYLPEDNLHAAFVGVAHMLFLPLLALNLPSATSVMNAMIGVLAALGTLSMTRAVATERAGRFAFWLLWATPIVLLVTITPRIDVTLLYFVVAGHLALLLAWKHGQGRLALLAAALLGAAIGVKYLGGLYTLALGPLFILTWVKLCRAKPWRAALLAIGSSLLMFGTAAPWLAKNYALLGAPLYPIGVAPHPDPWLQRVVRPESIAPEVLNRLATVHAQMREPFNLWDWLVNPERLAPDADARHSVPNPAFILLPFALLASRRRQLVLVVGPAFAYAVAILLVDRHTSLRYLIPALAGLTVAAAVGIDAVWGRIRQAPAARALGMLAIALPTAKAVAVRLAELRPFAHLIGVESASDYVARYGSYPEAVTWVNQHLSQSDTVLMLFEARAFYLTVPVRQDPLLRSWALLQPYARSTRCLRDTGVTHVLVNERAIRWLASRGVRMEDLAWPKFAAFAEECLTPRFQSGLFQIYQVASGEPADAISQPIEGSGR